MHRGVRNAYVIEPMFGKFLEWIEILWYFCREFYSSLVSCNFCPDLDPNHLTF